MSSIKSKSSEPSAPIGLHWRSSVWFITLVVGVGVGVDLGVYSLIVPVIPYQLQHLGYSQVSSKTSYLLLAYSLGLILSTPPIVWLSERFGGVRRWPLLLGLVFLAASQVMFMLAPNYAVMVVARFLQGVSGSTVWALGLSLLCDTVPEHKVGQQLGLATTGMVVGFSAGPPIGGALYQSLGFKAPFVFGIILTAVDFVGRLLVIERADAKKWGVDPWDSIPKEDVEKKAESKKDGTTHGTNDKPKEGPTSGNEEKPTETVTSQDANSLPTHDTNIMTENASHPDSVASPTAIEIHTGTPSSSPAPTKLSDWDVFRLLSKSPRAVSACVNTLLYGVILTSQEPTLTLRLEDTYGQSSLKVGLIYLAAVVPTIFSSPLVGWLTDQYGPEWIVLLFLLASAPWWMILAIHGPLALFIVSLALASFSISGTVTPFMSELAATSRGIEGVGYAHVFGVWNMAYSLGSAVGPIIGGQIYDHTPKGKGWLVVCVLQTALIIAAAVISTFAMGERPLMGRLRRKVIPEEEHSAEHREPVPGSPQE